MIVLYALGGLVLLWLLVRLEVRRAVLGRNSLIEQRVNNLSKRVDNLHHEMNAHDDALRKHDDDLRQYLSDAHDRISNLQKEMRWLPESRRREGV